MFTKYNNLKSTVLHHYLNETTHKKHTHTPMRAQINWKHTMQKEKTDMNLPTVCPCGTMQKEKTDDVTLPRANIRRRWHAHLAMQVYLHAPDHHFFFPLSLAAVPIARVWRDRERHTTYLPWCLVFRCLLDGLHNDEPLPQPHRPLFIVSITRTPLAVSSHSH